ncbi:hypothetical protein FJ973_29860 [Mesorhizobium sp. B2-1-3]|uniref:hypothetical protein n=1 Tax=Mesorhizobium sp. B2-1-3 TaxID=2589972 RepID=UPI001129FF50|nr:hypothetical protein [Mesorhizobium sp. B2-1-3]TPN03850.1 hypothetical protein FJ973_29860 [Mesorhizobium sp. B2-1-3]
MSDLATYDRWRTMPQEMTADEALETLKPLASVTDLEVAHSQADDVLCALLRGLGYGAVVNAWDKVGKWYA